ncbi:MAG: HAMP domain-containing protein [Verrucomicrobiales bacterium]|jgi:signal transduction histidine kinase|nr:HAMP domain-containing protein [Verrucomicrobiales bacterium]
MSWTARNKLGLGLSLRLSLWYGVLIAAVLLIVSGVTYLSMRRFIQEREVAYLKARATEYQHWLIQGGLPALQARFNDLQNQEKDGFFLRLIEPPNQLILHNNHIPKAMLTPEQIHQIPTSPQIFTRSQWTFYTLKINDRIILQAGKNSNEAALVLDQLEAIFLKIILPLIFATLIGGAVITYHTTRPLRDLNAAMQRILQDGALDTRVPLRPADPELGSLSALFNRLLEKNSRLMQLMRESIDNAAHDLRTPLTRLRNAAEAALSGRQTVEQLREGLADCLEESEYVLKMLAVTMDVAEAKTGSLPLAITAVNLHAVCARVIELYDIVAEEKNLRVTLAGAAQISVQADPVRLHQVIANLLDNAIKYSPADRDITLTVTRDTGHGILTVSDHGLGIAEQDLPRIWDRLFRADNSRSQRGLGLGLSLVQAIIQAHHGTISVASKLNAGSTFTLKIPLS